MILRLFFSCWIALVVHDAAADPLLFTGATMGTTYRVKLSGLPDSPVGKNFDAAGLDAAILAALDEIDRQMSTYRPESEVSRFGRANAGEWFAVSAATAEVVCAALDVSQQTDGALDVTVGPLVSLWHFGPPAAGDRSTAARFVPPSDELVNEARGRVGYEKLKVRSAPPALWKDVEALQIDLSAVAKGYAVDRVAELLVSRGIRNFMVEIGGEIRTAGCRPDGKPWRIGIARPRANRRELATAIELTDAALATSGDYRRFFEHGGRRYSHIIDPSTGRPAEQPLASATVVAESCMAADAWATALVVLGLERGRRTAEQHGVAARLVDRENGREVIRTTSPWRALFSDAP